MLISETTTTATTVALADVAAGDCFFDAAGVLLMKLNLNGAHVVDPATNATLATNAVNLATGAVAVVSDAMVRAATDAHVVVAAPAAL